MMLKVWAVLKATPAWVVKNWKLLLFPIGILLWVLGRSSKRTKVEVVPPTLDAQAKVEVKADAVLEVQTDVAKAQREAQLTALDKQNQAAIAQIQAESNAKMAELKAKPEEITPFLLDVNKIVQGGDVPKS